MSDEGSSITIGSVEPGKPTAAQYGRMLGMAAIALLILSAWVGAGRKLPHVK